MFSIFLRKQKGAHQLWKPLHEQDLETPVLAPVRLTLKETSEESACFQVALKSTPAKSRLESSNCLNLLWHA